MARQTMKYEVYMAIVNYMGETYDDFKIGQFVTSGWAMKFLDGITNNEKDVEWLKGTQLYILNKATGLKEDIRNI